MTKKKHFPIALLIVLIVLGAGLIGGAVFAVIKMNIKEPELDLDHTIPSEYLNEYPDVEKYFEENSTIRSISFVKDSEENYSEENVIDELESRGFGEMGITSYYSIDGTYDDSIEVSDSETQHPQYITYYESSSGELWAIIVVEDSITANPVTYNLQHPDSVQITVSEKNEIVSYDSSTNSYYRTIPNESALDLRIVDKIDAETLDSLTSEVLYNA